MVLQRRPEIAWPGRDRPVDRSRNDAEILFGTVLAGGASRFEGERVVFLHTGRAPGLSGVQDEVDDALLAGAPSAAGPASR